MPIDIKQIAANFTDNAKADLLGVTTRNFRQITPQKSYMFEIEISGGQVVPFSGLFENLTIFAKEVTIPTESISTVTYSKMGENRKFAGNESDPHTLTMTLFDDESATVRRYLDSWMQLQREYESGNTVHKKDYRRQLRIKTLDSTGAAVSSITTFNGCFIQEIGDINLSYDSSEAISIPVTLSYDTKKLIT